MNTISSYFLFNFVVFTYQLIEPPSMGEDNFDDVEDAPPQTFWQRNKTFIIAVSVVAVVAVIIIAVVVSRKGSGGGGGGGLSGLLGGPKSEVYYYDNAGNDGRYKLSFTDAKALATSLKGAVATPAQLAAAQQAGLDACWIGWGSDGSQYIPSITDWGSLSGCNTPGVQRGNYGSGAGVWVYGPKPANVAGGDCSKNPPTPCATPWSPTKWSQYA
jgi:hypothetical protein